MLRTDSIRGPVVVDASVVVEYLVDLTLTAQATALFGLLRDPDRAIELWAPDLLYPEVVSALRKLVRLRALRTAAASRCVERLIRLPIIHSSTAPLMADAWSLRQRISIYDACYVALAGRLDTRLVTADGKLARAARAERVVRLGDLC